MTMNEFRAVMKTAEAKPAKKKIALAAAIWLCALLLLVISGVCGKSNSAALEESIEIVRGGVLVKGLPDAEIERGTELSAVSSVVDDLGIREKVTRLSSNASGVTIDADRLYADELSNLIAALTSKGLDIQSADLKAVSSDEGRVITATVTIGGAKQ